MGRSSKEGDAMNTPQRYNWAGNPSREVKSRISLTGKATLLFEWALVSFVAIVVVIVIEKVFDHLLYAAIGGVLTLAMLAGIWKLIMPDAFTGR